MSGRSPTVLRRAWKATEAEVTSAPHYIATRRGRRRGAPRAPRRSSAPRSAAAGALSELSALATTKSSRARRNHPGLPRGDRREPAALAAAAFLDERAQQRRPRSRRGVSPAPCRCAAPARNCAGDGDADRGGVRRGTAARREDAGRPDLFKRVFRWPIAAGRANHHPRRRPPRRRTSQPEGGPGGRRRRPRGSRDGRPGGRRRRTPSPSSAACGRTETAARSLRALRRDRGGGQPAVGGDGGGRAGEPQA